MKAEFMVNRSSIFGADNISRKKLNINCIKEMSRSHKIAIFYNKKRVKLNYYN